MTQLKVSCPPKRWFKFLLSKLTVSVLTKCLGCLTTRWSLPWETYNLGWLPTPVVASCLCHQYQELNPTTNLNISRKIWQNTNHLHRIISWPGNPFKRSYHVSLLRRQRTISVRNQRQVPVAMVSHPRLSCFEGWDGNISQRLPPGETEGSFSSFCHAIRDTFWIKHFQLPFGALGSYAFEFKHPRYLFFITRKHPISAKKSFPNCRISQSLINPSANLKKQMRLVEPASLHPLVSGRPGWHETSCQVMQEDKSNWIKLVFSVWGCARIHNNTMSSCVAWNLLNFLSSWFLL